MPFTDELNVATPEGLPRVLAPGGSPEMDVWDQGVPVIDIGGPTGDALTDRRRVSVF